MLDVLVCTNRVNCTIALNGVLSDSKRPTLLLYDAARLFAPAVASSRVCVRRQRRWVVLLIEVIAAVGGLNTLYLPHHRVSRHILSLARRAKRVAYLDDGLDTRRRTPLNVVPSQIEPGAEYLTFEELATLAPWMADLTVRRVCSMAGLALPPGRSLPGLSGIRHVLFESPGLDAVAVMQGLALSPEETLLVEHPVPAKRSHLSGSFKKLNGADINAEALLDVVRDLDLYFGETMLLYYAVARCDSSNRIHAQLSPAQKENLIGLSFKAEPSAVVGEPLWLTSASSQ